MYLPGIEEAVERIKKERRGSQPRIKEEYIEDFTGLIGWENRGIRSGTHTGYPRTRVV